MRRNRDIRKMASGNPGTMNMLRNFGFKMAIVVLFLDALKAALPALLGYLLYTNLAGAAEGQIALFACGLAAMVGHCFPVIYKFHGGKGIASTFGVFMVANPLVAFLSFLVYATYAAIFEYAAMGSLMFLTTVVAYHALTIPSIDVVVAILLLVFYGLCFYMHRANIRRLLTGKENTASMLKRIKEKKKRKLQEQWLLSLREESTAPADI
jgi:glycerol-3-phosphate acyltransferase PlsY